MSRPTLRFTAPVGSGDLVVLGPSLGTTTVLWEKVIPALAVHYRVTAWDLPGHGASPAPSEAFTVEDLADAVAEAASGFGADRFRYAGVSLGGATGLALAMRHPERVAALAVVASGAKLGDPAGWAERAASVRERSTSALIAASAARWFAPESPAREPDLTGRLLHALQDADDEGYARCCEALAVYDVRDRLGDISAPVLVAWGEKDAVAPEATASEVVSGVRDGRIVRIGGVAHLPPAEDPAATARVLRDFFADASRKDRA